MQPTGSWSSLQEPLGLCVTTVSALHLIAGNPLAGKISETCKMKESTHFLDRVFRLFIANAKGTFFGMSESLEESSRRWNSSHVPYDSTNIPEKIYIPYIPNSKMPNAKWIKKKGRSPIDPQVQSKGAEREKVRARRKPKQAIFPGCRRSERGQRTEGPRASDIRTGESS